MYTRRLIAVFVILFIVAAITGKYFDYRYKKRWNWLFFEKIDETVSGKQEYDILFFGNSRIHTGINPYYVDSVTKMNSFNLAIGSGDEQEMKLLGTVYLQHHTVPKFVVLGLDNSMLVKNNILKERFAYLYYLDNDTIYSFMKKNNFSCGLIKKIPFLKYSFFDEYNRTSLFLGDSKIKKLFKHNFYKGFVNIFSDLNADSMKSVTNSGSSLFNTLSDKSSVNDTAMSTFSETVKMFLSKGCRVIFLFPPALQKERSRLTETADSFYAQLSEKYKIKEIRADKNPIFMKKYFIEGYHLNEPGSEILSILVADSIKSFVNKVP